MKNFTKSIVVLSFCVGLSSCAALGVGNKGVVKAPCGPTAGMTDPCGNRTPINKQQPEVDVFEAEKADV